MALLEQLLPLSVFFGVSFVAAAINSVAGGGTFLTFPVFILNGLTAPQANIMSTIALWPGVVASMAGYRNEFPRDKRRLWKMMAVGGACGAAGALWFLVTPEVTFTRLVPWLLLAATLIFTFGRRLTVQLEQVTIPPVLRRALAFLLLVATGIYGGYFGAGIGILTLAMLELLGFTHIHQMNAVKTLFTSIINLGTLVIFLLLADIIWHLAAVMIAGAVLGGYVGARTALKVSPQKVRLLVSSIGFVMTAYFFLYGA